MTEAKRPPRMRRPGAAYSFPDRGLIDGLECLEAVVAAGRPVSARTVARSLGMSVNRAAKLIDTLSHVGLLERTSQDAYRPGAGIRMLAALSLRASPLLEVALPYARRWWADGFAVTVCTPYKHHVCLLLHARPEWPFERAIAGHEVWPASWSSAGVALLATLPESETCGLAQPGRPQWKDPNESLADVLIAARRDGYARRAFRDGATALGVTIGDPPFAGLAVSRVGISDAVRPDVVAGLRETAAAIADGVRAIADRDRSDAPASDASLTGLAAPGDVPAR